jgi:hypothetical protein
MTLPQKPKRVYIIKTDVDAVFDPSNFSANIKSLQEIDRRRREPWKNDVTPSG